MKINLSPQRRDDTLSVSKTGDILTINGEPFDFSALLDGGELPADAISSDFIAGPVRREDGEINITLILPHGANPPQHVAFPEPVIVTEDGPIGVPQ